MTEYRMTEATVRVIEEKLGKPLSEEGLVIVETIVNGLAPSGAPGLWKHVADRVIPFSEAHPKKSQRILRAAQARSGTLS